MKQQTRSRTLYLHVPCTTFIEVTDTSPWKNTVIGIDTYEPKGLYDEVYIFREINLKKYSLLGPYSRPNHHLMLHANSNIPF